MNGEQNPNAEDTLGQMPKVTVITVTYNSGKTLRKTFESVASQSYKNIELIVIDGGSIDDTLKIIADYEQCIGYWVSEPDKGIYNAMNKGIGHASGELVYFLNSDDLFYDTRTVQDVVVAYIKHKRPDVIYGDVMTYSAGQAAPRRSGRKLGLRQMGAGRVICHQAIFMKNQVLQKYRFNEEYKIAADFELQVKCLKDSCKFVYIEQIISYYCIDGLSSSVQGKHDTVYEKMRIIKAHFDTLTYYQFYMFAKLKLMRMAGRKTLREILHKTPRL